MADSACYIELASNNGDFFTNSLTDDIMIRPQYATQKVLIGTSNGQVPSLTITSNNVGIGTTTPAYKLDVAGDINFTGAFRQNGTPYIGSQWSNSGANVFITGSNVGIGTTSPQANIHINNDVYVGANSATWNTSAGKGIFMRYSTNGVQDAAYIQSSTRSTSTLHNMFIQGSNIQIGPQGTGSATPTLYLQNDGKVGMSTSSPAYTLDVAGDMRTCNITMNSNGVITLLGSNWGGRVQFDSYMSGACNQNLIFISRGGFEAAKNHMVFHADSSHSNSGFHFMTNNATTRMFIDAATGKIGVGLSNPNAKLDIVGDVEISNPNNALHFTISNNNNPYMQIHGSNGALVFGVASTAGNHSSDAAAGDSIIKTLGVSTGRIIIQTQSGASSMTINSNNYVGIGTTTPTAPLHVVARSGNPATNGIYVYNPSTNAASNAVVATRVNGGSGGNPYFSMDIDGVTGWSMGISNADSDKFVIKGSWDFSTLPYMTIDGSGNTGLGTTTPSYRLDVNSNINISGGDSWGSGLLLGGANERIYRESTASAYRGLIAHIDTNSNFSVVSTGAQVRMQVSGSTGRVGIGTTSAETTLHVSSNATTNGTIIQVDNPNTGTGGWSGFAARNSSGGMRMGMLGTGWTTSGIYHQNGGFIDCDCSNGISMAAKSNTGTIRFYAGGTNEAMRVHSNSNVGIGTTNPTYRLDVAANARLNNAVIGDVGHGAFWTAFAHSNSFTTTGFGLLHSSAGQTLVNAASGQTINLRIANQDYGIFNSTGLLLSTAGGTASYKLDVNGSTRLGNTSGQSLYVHSLKTGESIFDYNSTMIGHSLDYIPSTSNFVAKTDGTNASFSAIIPSFFKLRFLTGSFGGRTTDCNIPFANMDSLTRMTIDSVGNVGIGTISPAYKLDITGEARARGRYWLTDGSSSSNMVLGHFGGDGNGDFHLWDWERARAVLAYYKTNNYVTFPTGSVGVGTTTPGYQLDIRGSVGISNAGTKLRFYDNDYNTNRHIVLYEAASNQHQFYGFGINQGTLRYQVEGTNGNHVFYAAASSSASTELMRIAGGGNVGIGTSAPGYKLDVNGYANIDQTFFFQDALPSYGNSSTNRRYALIATAGGNQGFIRIEGIVGGHDSAYAGQGKCRFDIVVDSRNTTLRGNVANLYGNNSAGIVIYRNNTSADFTVYVTGQHYNRHNIRITGADGMSIVTSLSWSSDTAWSTPAGTTLWFDSLTHIPANSLGTEFIQTASTHPNPLYGVSTLSSANVGVGTRNPSYKLDVSGTAKTTSSSSITGVLAQCSDVSTIVGNVAGATNYGSVQVRSGGSSSAVGASTYHLYLQPDGGNVFTGSGNVGIGTTSPVFKMDVSGQLRAIGTGTPFSGLTIHNTGGGGTPTSSGAAIDFRGYNANSFSARIRSGDATSGGWGGTLLFYTKTANGADTDSLTEAMRINEAQNVGIGAASNPAYRLDVLAANQATAVIRVGDTTFQNGRLMLGNSSHGIARGANIGGASDGNDVTVYTAGTGAVTLATGGGEGLRVSSAGNVGVGGAPGSYKLDVTGQMRLTYNSDSGIHLTGNGNDINYSVQNTGTGGRRYLIGAGNNSSGTPGNFYIYDATAGAGFRLNIDSSGRVGIGTVSPSYQLHVAGSIYATGDIIGFSDKRLKSNITLIDSALSKIHRLNGYTFNIKDDEKLHTGLIAQEVLDVLPEAVYQEKNRDGTDGYYSLAYGNMAGLFVEAIKELDNKYKADIDDLRKQVIDLKNEITSLKQN